MKKCAFFIVLILSLLGSATAQQSGLDLTESSKREVLKQHKANKNYRYGKKGYFGNASFTFTDFGAFLDDEGWLIDKPHYGVDIINGYSFNPYLDLGIGLGAHYQPSKDKTEQYIMLPAYLYLRYNVLDRRVSPYLAAKAGWAGVVYREKSGEQVGKFNKWGGSTYTNLEVGAMVRLRDGKAINVGVGMPWYFVPLLATGISVNVGFTW